MVRIEVAAFVAEAGGTRVDYQVSLRIEAPCRVSCCADHDGCSRCPCPPCLRLSSAKSDGGEDSFSHREQEVTEPDRKEEKGVEGACRSEPFFLSDLCVLCALCGGEGAREARGRRGGPSVPKPPQGEKANPIAGVRGRLAHQARETAVGLDGSQQVGASARRSADRSRHQQPGAQKHERVCATSDRQYWRRIRI